MTTTLWGHLFHPEKIAPTTIEEATHTAPEEAVVALDFHKDVPEAMGTIFKVERSGLNFKVHGFENTLAQYVLDAAAARENSYDHEASRKADEEANIKRQQAFEEKRSFFPYIDYNKFYGLTLQQACEKVCPKDLATPVYLMLECAWNDVLDWANELVERKAKETLEIGKV